MPPRTPPTIAAVLLVEEEDDEPAVDCGGEVMDAPGEPVPVGAGEVVACPLLNMVARAVLSHFGVLGLSFSPGC